MRVLMLSKACIWGTYQRKLEEIAKHPDVELMVVVPPEWRDRRGVTRLERAYTQGYRLVVEPMVLNGHFHLHFYPGLGKHLRAFRPDVFHIDEEPWDFVTFHALRLGCRAGAKSLFFTWQNLARAYPPPFAWIQAYVFRHAAYAIAGNQDAAKVLRGKGYAGPVRVIPQFGVDTEIYREMQETKGKQGFTIGFVGRLVEEKGMHVLLRAVAGLEGDWQVRLLGSGPERARLEALARELGIAARVTMDAPIPSVETPAYYNRLDVLVLPSVSRPNWVEQFGRVLVEAMACGVPVIGSTCGELPNVIGDAGLVFVEGDVEALRASLARLMADAGLRAHLSGVGRARVLAHYTQTRIAAETVDVYREIMSR